MEIRLDPASSVPIYIQIADRIRQMVAAGLLKPGAQLPTIRQLAVDLTIDPNTVARAYALLDSEGVISTQRGRGTYVAERPNSAQMARIRADKLQAILRRCIMEVLSQGYSPPEVLMAFSQLLNQLSPPEAAAPGSQGASGA
jgi:GntR family transcriptional regulator